jgi:hypothetical protein
MAENAPSNVVGVDVPARKLHTFGFSHQKPTDD